LYEDRLIAEDYILKMTVNIYKIKEALNTESITISKSDTIRNLISDFYRNYDAFTKTKLTTTEKIVGDELTSFIKNFEFNNYSNTKYTDKALFSLKLLAAVQIEESKLIMIKAE